MDGELEKIEERKKRWPVGESPYMDILESHGVNLDLLAEKLKEELEYTDHGKKPSPAAMRIRQAARIDGQAVFDVYPVEKKAGNMYGDVHIQVINYGEPKKIEE